jgi:hypothetical protein
MAIKNHELVMKLLCWISSFGTVCVGFSLVMEVVSMMFAHGLLEVRQGQ